MQKTDPFPDDPLDSGYTCLLEDLFIPTGMYLSEEGGVPIIFDSGFSVAVSPCKEDFGNKLIPVSNTMMGLGAAVIVEGEGTVQ